jgi:hypothetical protein
MALIHPYVTDKFTAYEGDSFITRLSFAVRLKDDFTEEKPASQIKVTELEENIIAAKNRSGYYFFTDLAGGNHTIRIFSGIYFSQELTKNTSLLDPKDPVIEVILKPAPSYPFPSNATLIRGVISNPDLNMIKNLKIKAIEPNLETTTDEKGEFVLYFRNMKNKDITIEISKNSLSKTVNTSLDEGKTRSLGKIIFP